MRVASPVCDDEEGRLLPNRWAVVEAMPAADCLTAGTSPEDLHLALGPKSAYLPNQERNTSGFPRDAGGLTGSCQLPERRCGAFLNTRTTPRSDLHHEVDTSTLATPMWRLNFGGQKFSRQLDNPITGARRSGAEAGDCRCFNRGDVRQREKLSRDGGHVSSTVAVEDGQYLW